MRLRSPLALAAFLTGALACAAPAAAVETGVNETPGQTVPTAQRAAHLGADWTRLWISWEQIQPARGAYEQHWVDDIRASVDALKARGVKVLVVVQRSPAWASRTGAAMSPPRDPATFGAFMGAIAQRLPSVDAWEIWNEPDEREFFAGAPDPAHYAAMLRAAYPAIKAVQPGDVVVSGGLVGNDVDFLADLYAHGAQGAFDAVAVHTDTACLTRGPDAYYRDERGRIGRYTFSAYREVHAVMTEHGDGAKPIWMTEIGWSTKSTRPGSCNRGTFAGAKRLGVTPRRQARFLRAAYRCAAADPFVGPVFWFGIQDIPAAGHAAGYGLYRRSGRAKPAARAFRRLDRGIRPRRRCGGVVDRTPPSIQVVKPADGLRFSRRLTVKVRAADNAGGTGIGRIGLDADGSHVRSWGSATGTIAPWWATEGWRPGEHTLTFSVRDRAQNPASVTVRVVKVRSPKR